MVSLLKNPLWLSKVVDIFLTIVRTRYKRALAMSSFLIRINFSFIEKVR